MRKIKQPANYSKKKNETTFHDSSKVNGPRHVALIAGNKVNYKTKAGTEPTIKMSTRRVMCV